MMATKQTKIILISGLVTLGVVAALGFGTGIPIPLLILYAVVSTFGGIFGRTAGITSGSISAFFVMFSFFSGFGELAQLENIYTSAFAALFILLSGMWVGSIKDRSELRHDGLQEKNLQLENEIKMREEAQFDVSVMRQRLSEAMAATRIASWELDEDGKLYWSPEAFELFALGPEELDATVASFQKRVHPDDRDQLADDFKHAWEQLDEYSFKHRIITGHNQTLTVRETGKVQRDDNGKPLRVLGMIQDVSEAVALERKLQQAQKMEAIGQLTGGIAHDFNNLLAVILGNAELILEKSASPEDATSEIVRASERGAELTQRLLAFSRKQPLRPEAIDMGALINSLLDLLKRTLGVTIEIENHCKENAVWALADPGQVENAILNLAINARDAMPKGGRLILNCNKVTVREDEGEDLAAGHYAKLSVTDQGTGMSSEVRKHAFEPFFTTKDVGAGSGLGLSMVYGFAQQSGGQATIESDDGIGTTVNIFLPQAQLQFDSQEKPPAEMVPRGHGETILVIEDDPQVGNLAEAMLLNLGYKVICAEDASSAKISMNSHPEIDLVLSDVMLPGGKSGPDIARGIKNTRPELKVIFMSGRPDAVAVRDGGLAGDNVLLSKPFRLAQLATSVHTALR